MAKEGPAEPTSRSSSKKHRAVAIFAVVAVGALLFIWALGDIFAPVFAALALAYMLDPFVKRLETRGWPRRRAVLVVFSATVFLIVAILSASVPFVARDVSYVVSAAKIHLDRAGADEEEGAAEIAPKLESEGAAARRDGLSVRLARAFRRSETMRKILEWAEENQLVERVSSWLKENARLVAEQTLNAARGGLAIVFRIGWCGFMTLLFPVYLYFFMAGLGELTKRTFDFVPPALRPKAESVAHEFGAALSAFFRGRLVVALAIGLFTATGFAVAGLRFGVFLGIAIGIASMVPFVNIVFLVPALIIAPIQFESVWWMLIIFGIYAVGQGLDPLLTPCLMSRGTGLHPVTIIVSLLVWGRLLGAVGLLMAVPLTAAVKIAGREILLPALAAGGPVAADPETGT